MSEVLHCDTSHCETTDLSLTAQTLARHKMRLSDQLTDTSSWEYRGFLIGAIHAIIKVGGSCLFGIPACAALWRQCHSAANEKQAGGQDVYLPVCLWQEESLIFEGLERPS